MDEKQLAQLAEDLGWTEFFKGKEYAIWGDESFARGLLLGLGSGEESALWVTKARRILQEAQADPARYEEETLALWWEVGPKTGLTMAGVRYFGGPHILVASAKKSSLAYVGKALLLRREKEAQASAQTSEGTAGGERVAA